MNIKMTEEETNRRLTVSELMAKSPTIKHAGFEYKLVAVKALLLAVRGYRGPANYNGLSFTKEVRIAKKWFSLHVSKELHQLLKGTAKHAGVEISDVIRRVGNGVRRGQDIPRTDIPESLYKRPSVCITIRNFALPHGVQPEDFRRLLAAHCMQELNDNNGHLERNC